MRMDEDGVFQSNVWGKLGASMLCCQYHVLGQMLMAEGSKQDNLKKQFQDVLNHLSVSHLELLPLTAHGVHSALQIHFFHLCLLSQQ